MRQPKMARDRTSEIDPLSPTASARRSWGSVHSQNSAFTDISEGATPAYPSEVNVYQSHASEAKSEKRVSYAETPRSFGTPRSSSHDVAHGSSKNSIHTSVSRSSKVSQCSAFTDVSDTDEKDNPSGFVVAKGSGSLCSECGGSGHLDLGSNVQESCPFCSNGSR
mmetsp:Transcript_20617/g.36694  ORF Transcript_20617/g.36694 Transcript_20617/m.36694 type:complete len:165 (-) Transcript_20617:74-568(-)